MAASVLVLVGVLSQMGETCFWQPSLYPVQIEEHLFSPGDSTQSLGIVSGREISLTRKAATDGCTAR